jgi:outer membrane protein assembly factor BamB
MKKYSNLKKGATFLILLSGIVMTVLSALIFVNCQGTMDSPKEIIKKIGSSRGICVLLEDIDCKLAIKLAKESEFLIYVQLTNAGDLETARIAADEAGFYGNRIFIEDGEFSRIHLAGNLADFLIAADKNINIKKSEVLRILRPEGKAFIGNKKLIKPFPEGIDDWSHPYHGPDNNPQSADKIARAPYVTQFLAKPYYAPLTQVCVASGGRVFKAYGNLAFHIREEHLLNTLVAYNGYNGTELWRRRLRPGVMIHRNTMIATPEVLYVGDDNSCKIIDAATGNIEKEIITSKDNDADKFWKWMALEDGILYALIGAQEQKDPVLKQRREAHGWPWDPLSKGYNQPENPWGYGKNLLAIEPESEKVLWSHQEDKDIDSRALCMKNGKIFIYRYGNFLACLDAKTGKDIWRKTPDNSPGLFNALGKELNRQDWRTNFRTTVYMKCSDKALYFAGPTVGKLLAVDAENGNVLWENPYDNFQLVLRDDGLYGISGQIDMHKSMKFDPLTGNVLSEIDTKRRACTRPNGTVDAIIYRAHGGSTRLDIASQTAQWISPMRAQCQDGVTIANGLLYWWPSICDCQNQLYGITCLGPAGDFDFSQKATEKERLKQYDLKNVANLDQISSDWPTFRANNYGNVTTEIAISEKAQRLWWFTPENEFTPTAPVAVGDLLFFSGSDGIVRAVGLSTGKLRWKAYTGGPVRFPPTVWQGRLLVGSGDGWVYAFEALTGRLLWKFNAAPEHRKIPVYGSLMSTWPVASGVIIENGIAYFAAGIVNYDGTHVYALDASDGTIKWQNNISGHLKDYTGVSVQGHMLINDGKLYLASGTSISPAVFDIQNGKCLNDTAPLQFWGSVSLRGYELYKIGDKVVAGGMPLYGHPDYPVFDASVTEKVLHTSANGKDILLLNNQKLFCFNPIDKQALNNSVYDLPEEPVFTPRWGQLKINDDPLWQYDCGEAVAMVRCANAIIISVKPNSSKDYEVSHIEAIDIKNGQMLWSRPLISPPLPWGLITDRDGRIIVMCRDGQIMCFGREGQLTEL